MCQLPMGPGGSTWQTPAQCPARVQRLIEQIEQAGLGGRIHPVWDPATQPQPSFPLTSISFTAISVSVADNRPLSAIACSSS